ncbi:hypothetical protein SCORR_v1c05020 [Spiroplasma corruscae]|uniref:Lipoprotein n=1 Tax=Spiroplasma corruscae TaxID=216934 RepID=A0A222EPS7_9MOLU|nr:hypothetical protein [Spiroplasma corruscae]ASP28274.1 hypothetical protein SCORR_v1c05020 [Spiroplasma corruscae]
MKKISKSFLSLCLMFLPISTIACSNNNINPDFANANNLIAFENIFTNMKKEYYSLNPSLTLKKNNSIKTTPGKFLLKDNAMYLNCDDYICDNNEFKGIELTNELYSNPNLKSDKEIKSEVQIAFDYLAYYFSITPLVKKNVFYNFDDLFMKIYYDKSNYIIIRDKEVTENITLSTNQLILINNDSNSLEQWYTGSDSSFILDSSFLTSILPKFYLLTQEKEPLNYSITFNINESNDKDINNNNNNSKISDYDNYILDIKLNYNDGELVQDEVISKITSTLEQLFLNIENINFAKTSDTLVIKNDPNNEEESPNVEGTENNTIDYKDEKTNKIDKDKLDYIRTKVLETTNFKPFNIENYLVNRVRVTVEYTHNKSKPEEGESK